MSTEILQALKDFLSLAWSKAEMAAPLLRDQYVLQNLVDVVFFGVLVIIGLKAASMAVRFFRSSAAAKVAKESAYRARDWNAFGDALEEERNHFMLGVISSLVAFFLILPPLTEIPGAITKALTPELSMLQEAVK
jgi:hypothetical protein